MTADKFVAEQIAPIFQADLKNHTATLLSPNLLRFSKGGSPMGRIDFMIHDGNLIVTGDYGFAIYSFAPDLTFESFSNFNLSYFASKATATEVGRLAKDWSERLASLQLEELDVHPHVKTQVGDALGDHGDQDSFRAKITELRSDGYDTYDVQDLGMHVHARTAVHLEALKLAIRRLT